MCHSHQFSKISSLPVSMLNLNGLSIGFKKPKICSNIDVVWLPDFWENILKAPLVDASNKCHHQPKLNILLLLIPLLFRIPFSLFYHLVLITFFPLLLLVLDFSICVFSFSLPRVLIYLTFFFHFSVKHPSLLLFLLLPHRSTFEYLQKIRTAMPGKYSAWDRISYLSVSKSVFDGSCKLWPCSKITCWVSPWIYPAMIGINERTANPVIF